MFVGFWILVMLVPAALSSSNGALYVSSAALWMAGIMMIIISIVFLYRWFTDKITGYWALATYLDIYLAVQIANAGVLMTGWILDTNPAKNTHLALSAMIPTPGLYGAFFYLLCNSFTLFNGGVYVSLTPISMSMHLWTAFSSFHGVLVLMGPVAYYIRKRLEEGEFQRFYERPYGTPPPYPSAKHLQREATRYSKHGSSMQNNFHGKKKVKLKATSPRVFVSEGGNQWKPIGNHK